MCVISENQRRVLVRAVARLNAEWLPVAVGF